jgi:uncharacterized protein (DUF1330 family)
MAAYVVVDIEVTDREGFAEYRRMVRPTVAAYGGKYLAASVEVEVLEGSWAPRRLVILEFESTARAREWLESPEYRDARLLRQRSTRTNMVVVPGE